MTEMIERVSKAIVVAVSSRERGSSISVCEVAARAAIEAMREPTDGMVMLGMLAGTGPEFADPDETWRTMIDGALKGGV